MFLTSIRRKKKSFGQDSLAGFRKRRLNSENYPKTRKLVDELNLEEVFGENVKVCLYRRNEDLNQNVCNKEFINVISIYGDVERVKNDVSKKKKDSSKTKQDWLSIRTRGSPKVLYNLMKNLSPAQMKDIIDIRFGSMIGMASEEILGKIAHFVVDNFDDDSMKLKLSNNVISITPELVYKVLGVPLGAQMKDIIDIRFGSMIGMASEEILGKIAHFVVDNFDDDSMKLKLSNNVISITPELVYKVLGVPLGECETKWYYLGCCACNFGVDPKTEDYKVEEFGIVKKKIVGYICKNKSCGEDGAIDVFPEDFNDLLEKKLAFKVDITDYNLSKNKYVYGVSQICQEANVIEELQLKVPTLEANVSSLLTPSLGFISPPSRLKYQ
nr:hypothetical protein [Tanacetum cinerariifolium]